MFDKTMVRLLLAVALRKKIVCLALLLPVSALARGSNINLVTNGSFENPVVSGYYQFQPPSTDWTYTSLNAGGSGISNGSGSYGFNTDGSIPDGNQFCFLQRIGNYVSEQVTFPATGMYELSYFAGGREQLVSPADYGGNTDYGIYLDSTLVTEGTTTTQSTMFQRGPVYFTESAGTKTFEILITGVGTNPTLDQSALFDDVSITAVSTPEPSTFALLSVGVVALIGYRWNRRKNPKSRPVRL